MKEYNMNKFDSDFNPDELMQFCLGAIHEIKPADLAYLFATGKSELEIRNQIALAMHRNRSENQVIAREWKRHDLAVIENGIPRLIIEGKSWIHADAANPKKLNKGKSSIKASMLRDLKKLKNTAKSFGTFKGYLTITIFTVDVSGRLQSEIDAAHIKYAKSHKKALDSKSIGFDGGGGRGALSEMLTKYGLVKREPLNVSHYLDFRVFADFFLIKPFQ